MKKKNVILLMVGGLIILIVSTILFIMNNLEIYGIITGTLMLLLGIILIIYIKSSRSEDSIYLSSLKYILKTFDSVLVNSEKLPDLKDRNLIKVVSFDDIIDAQLEIRKPIYYKEEEGCCSFILLDDKEACYYILKRNDDVIAPLEVIINQVEEDKKNGSVNHSILDDIEKTTIIKLENNKTYKVSPVGSKDKKEIKEGKESLEDILPKLKQ